MTPRCDPSSPNTRKALLEAALFCFAERGFEGTSLRMVADRADKHMSLIAHHFGNKDGLYLAVFRDMLENLVADRPMPPGAPAPPRDADEAAARLRWIIRNRLREMHFVFEHGDPKRAAYFRLWLSAVRMPLPELEPLLREGVAPLKMQIADCIRTLRPDFPDRDIPFWCALIHGQFLTNTMFRRFNELVFGPESYPPTVDELADHIADITLRAIGRPEPA
ncbi:TetR/AcrR family transcriptional regulator [uncultured Tolumonas sp.]|uniref:TetR/AcrR family transcriptional regulator n=1 Tax=uncultured Tolumonas sp. TaxID=263765 RepID=UPI00292E9F57|nr:TetR/AcrR family transcriptional regulator [uncultured Tolumonas sp.]